jgi:prepilin-type N-terminal cleavage/methylation domain-containing protein
MIDLIRAADPRTGAKAAATGASRALPAPIEFASKDTAADESGFSLAEMLMASAILLVISVAVFGALDRIQQTARHQAEVQAVLDNVRNALQIMERCIRQAGNDPYQRDFEAISIVSSTEVRIRSDITGSAGSGNKGDPDGDINDSGENLLIRYNEREKRLEIASRGGPAQIIAENISGLSLQYFDRDGNPTATGARVSKIIITLSGSSTYKDPRTGERFGMQLESTIRILS